MGSYEINIFVQGFLLQASLILALGAQNLFVIDIGLKRNHHILAATICALCDVILIVLGVIGVSALIADAEKLKTIVTLLGSLFLFYYAIKKFIEAFKARENSTTNQQSVLTRKGVVLTSLGFTLLNPHVYLDTFFLIGGYSSRFDLMTHKLTFAFGAGFFSILWFYFLAFFSAKFNGLISKERNLKTLSLITAIVLTFLALQLAQEALSL